MFVCLINVKKYMLIIEFIYNYIFLNNILKTTEK